MSAQGLKRVPSGGLGRVTFKTLSHPLTKSLIKTSKKLSVPRKALEVKFSSSPGGVTEQNCPTTKDLVCKCASLWMADFFFGVFFLGDLWAVHWWNTGNRDSLWGYAGLWMHYCVLSLFQILLPLFQTLSCVLIPQNKQQYNNIWHSLTQPLHPNLDIRPSYDTTQPHPGLWPALTLSTD